MTILIIEDEPLVRLVAAQNLEDEGYEVIEAANADAAIKILLTRTDVRLIFTDIDMPGSMDGLRFAAVVRNRWPPIHIIITSGKQRPELASLPMISTFLPKPYLAQDLVSAVRLYA